MKNMIEPCLIFDHALELPSNMVKANTVMFHLKTIPIFFQCEIGLRKICPKLRRILSQFFRTDHQMDNLSMI